MSEQPSRTRTYSWDDPSHGLQAAMSMSGLEYMQAIARGDLPRAPISYTMNMTGMAVESGKATFYAIPEEYLYNPIGTVHGGAAATLLDSALGCCIHTMLPQGTAYTTLELHVNYVRPLTRETGEVRAVAEVLHFGKRIATAQARLLDQDDKLYAHGTTTCLIITP